MNTKTILDFFAESGVLKRTKRSGWWVLGIPEEETVAAHSFRCAVICYVLAKMEEVPPYEAVMMGLFNDIHESRITDLHKIAHMYIKSKKAEKDAFNDQVKQLPAAIKDELVSLRKKYDSQKLPAALIARDADILECLLQAKEYYDTGLEVAEKFFRAMPDLLKTKSAKKLWQAMKKWDSAEWWETLGKFER